MDWTVQTLRCLSFSCIIYGGLHLDTVNSASRCGFFNFLDRVPVFHIRWQAWLMFSTPLWRLDCRTHAKARRLSQTKLAIARREFAVMEKLCIIHRSLSSWGLTSPLCAQEGTRQLATMRWLQAAEWCNSSRLLPCTTYPGLRNELQGCCYFSKIWFAAIIRCLCDQRLSTR